MLHDAARVLPKDKIKRLIKKLGRDAVNKKEKEYEQTPLHVACDAGRLDVAQLLIDTFRADVNVVDKNGWTPLHSAANAGHLKICELLLQRGAFARALSNEGASPLHYLVRHAYDDPNLCYQVFRLFLDKGADVNHANRHGETALHQAAHRGREQNVLFLLNAKAQLNLATRFGETPLHFAVRSGQKEVVSMLLRFGADPSLVSASGSPLDIALAQGRTEIVELLQQALARASAAAGPSTSAGASTPTCASASASTPALPSVGGLAVSSSGALSSRLPASGSLVPAHRTASLPNISSTQGPTPAPAAASSSSPGSSESSTPDASPGGTLSQEGARSREAACAACARELSWQVPGVLELALQATRPHVLEGLTDEELRRRGARLSHDLACVGEEYFIKALLEIPLLPPPPDPPALPPTSAAPSLSSSSSSSSSSAAGSSRAASPSPPSSPPHSQLQVAPARSILVIAVWVRVSEAIFTQYVESWHREDRATAADPSQMPVQLASLLPFYPNTLGLSGFLRLREPGRRPLLFLDADAALTHPLSQEVRDGLPFCRYQHLLWHLVQSQATAS